MQLHVVYILCFIFIFFVWMADWDVLPRELIPNSRYYIWTYTLHVNMHCHRQQIQIHLNTHVKDMTLNFWKGGGRLNREKVNAYITWVSFLCKKRRRGGGGVAPSHTPLPRSRRLYMEQTLCLWPLMLSDFGMIILVNMWLMDWNLDTCVWMCSLTHIEKKRMVQNNVHWKQIEQTLPNQPSIFCNLKHLFVYASSARFTL